ncbi:1642_t:CDS:1, partial [Dentiscutata erythropus]
QLRCLSQAKKREIESYEVQIRFRKLPKALISLGLDNEQRT